MATSVVSICNMALARLGIDQTIEDLDDNNQRARMCKLFYEPCRDQLLRDGLWGFSMTVAALAPVDVLTPGYSYGYRYPASALKLLDMSASAGHRWPIGVYERDPWQPMPIPSTAFKVMADPTTDANIVVTDLSEAYAWYVKKVTIPTLFDPLFVSTLAWRLAAEIALPLKAKVEFSRNAMDMATAQQSIAQAVALNEGAPDRGAESVSIAARY